MAGKGEGGIGLLLLAFFLAFAATAVQAAPPSKTILLLASRLSYDDLRPGGPLPNVRRLADAGAVALLNTAVAGTRTEAAGYLSVGAGERMAAPDTAAAEQAHAPEAPTPEGDPARAVYRRRFGAWPPPQAALLHLGIPALRRAQPSASRGLQIGALGEALAAAGLRAAAYGDWRAALVLTDARGAIPHGALASATPDPARLAPLLSSTDVLAVSTRDAAALDAFAGAALPLVRAGRARVIVAIPAPPPGRLGFVVAAGPDIAPRSRLVSPTTRTPGLVANVDLAPTVLAWHNLSPVAPVAMAGRAVRTSASPAPWRATATLDRQVVATANATVPVLVGYGTFAMGVALLALVALATRRAAVAQRARFGLLMAAAALVALLAMGIWSPRSPWLYGFGVIGVSAVLACLATLVGPRLGVPPLGVLLVVTAAAVAIDALFGAPLVSHALLSGYYLPGIRFYGIGNEFSSLSIGAALVGFFLTPRPSFRSGNAGRGTRKAALLLWIAVVVATGVPAWGADAGGALSGTMTFAMAFLALRAGRLRARHVAIALAVGVAVTLTFALLDRLRPEEARSHVGAAVAAGQSRGPDALWEIVRNKVAMSLRLTATPGAAGALAGLGLIGWILFRGPLAGRVAAVLTARPDLRTVLAPAAWGALAATLFNDSGIIPALLLLTPPTAAVIDGLLCDSSQWITEPGASASPPATIWGGAPTR